MIELRTQPKLNYKGCRIWFRAKQRRPSPLLAPDSGNFVHTFSFQVAIVCTPEYAVVCCGQMKVKHRTQVLGWFLHAWFVIAVHSRMTFQSSESAPIGLIKVRYELNSRFLIFLCDFLMGFRTEWSGRGLHDPDVVIQRI